MGRKVFLTGTGKWGEASKELNEVVDDIERKLNRKKIVDSPESSTVCDHVFIDQGLCYKCGLYFPETNH